MKIRMEDENFIIGKVIEDNLANTSIDLLQDYAQLGMEELLNNSALQEFPFVKSVIGAIKGAVAIREIHFAKKLFTFFRAFYQGELNEEKRLEFSAKIKSGVKLKDCTKSTAPI